MTEARRFTLRKTLIATMALLSAAIVISVISTTVSAVKTALKAEHQLHAVKLMDCVVASYVEATGNLPSSKRDLESVVLTDGCTSTYRWPIDAEVVSQYVKVNFQLANSNSPPTHWSEVLITSQPHYTDLDERATSLTHALQSLASHPSPLPTPHSPTSSPPAPAPNSSPAQAAASPP